MKSILLLIGLIVSSVSFADENQLSCLYFRQDPADGVTGLLDEGAWKTNKIIFNTDDFGKSSPLLTLIVEMKYQYEGRVVESDWSYDDLRYEVSPSSLIFAVQDEFGTLKYRINRTNLTISAGNTDGECSIGDVDILKSRVF